MSTDSGDCRRRVSRRGVLLGASGAAVVGVVGVGELVDHRVLPGRTWLREGLGFDGQGGHVPDVAAGSVERDTTAGIDWALCLPPGVSAGSGARGLPVLVALSGKGTSRDRMLGSSYGLPQFLAASRLRMAVLAVAGEDSYYHPRRDGSDVGALVLDRLLPMLGRRGLDVRRPGFMGWSMGGYGALLLAGRRREQGRPVAGVSANSPAIFASASATAAGAFDDAADFERWNVVTRRHYLRGVPTRIYCGDDDPFHATSRAYARETHARFYDGPGAHTAAYWRRVQPPQMPWLGQLMGAAPRA